MPTPTPTPTPTSPLTAALPGLMTCVHCGFCLQACPTYLATGDENDSPRGRIALMRAVAEAELPLADPDVQHHLDRCLGCRACETACPSGVPYGTLLEESRAALAAVHPIARSTRAVLWTFAHPRVLAAVLTLARIVRASGSAGWLGRMRGRLGFAFAMLAATRPALRSRVYHPRTPPTRGTVALLNGCVMDGLYAGTNDAARRTLAANGYAPVDAPRQRCCGALHAHAGDRTGARALARANIAAFEQSGADWVAVTASGCGAMMKEYAHLLADDPDWSGRAASLAARVRDATELLAIAGPRPGAPLPMTVAYDAPCHLVHAQRAGAAPLTVLANIPALRVESLPGADQCCGSAGLYSLLQPALALTVLAPKVEQIARSGAPLVTTANPGCLMHIGAGVHRAGLAVRVVHPLDLLDASYARLDDR